MNVDDARNHANARNHAEARKPLGENEKEAGADDNDAPREPGQPLPPFDTVQLTDLIEETELALRNAMLEKGTLPQDLVVFQGFLGEAHDPLNPNNRRLYFNLQFNEYIEFRSQDVVVYHSVKLAPLASMLIWLPRTAQIKHVRMQTLDLQRSFLQGNMAIPGAPQSFSPPGSGSGGGSFLTCGGGSFLTCGGGTAGGGMVGG